MTNQQYATSRIQAIKAQLKADLDKQQEAKDAKLISQTKDIWTVNW